MLTHKRLLSMIGLALIALLLAACQEAAPPMPTPAPATATPVPPTATPIPPTSTPEPENENG